MFNTQTKKCPVCSVVKVHRARGHVAGRFYVDENNHRWRRGVCPQCKPPTKVRAKRLEVNWSHYDKVLDPLTQRKCRKCARLLPASRYFECYECVPIQPTINDDFIYNVWGSV